MKVFDKKLSCDSSGSLNSALKMKGRYLTTKMLLVPTRSLEYQVLGVLLQNEV